MFVQLEKYSKVATVLVLCVLPFLVWAAASVRTGAANVHDWLPEHREERIVYDRFTKLFGDDQFILVTWQGCTIEDPRLEELSHLLRELNLSKSNPIFDSVETTADVLAALQNAPLNMEREVAESKLHGYLLGKDGTACVLLKLSKLGIENGEQTLRALEKAIDSVPGLDRNDVHMAGTLFEEVSVDRASERSLRYLVPPSTLCAIFVAFVALRKVKASALVFILAGMGQLIAVSVVHYSGGEFSAVLIVLPTLVFMLTLSAAVHLVNYYGDSHSQSQRGVRTLFIGLKPTALATITTMFGMASLAVSELAPVRSFGIYSALALGVASIVMLSVFPALSDLFLAPRDAAAKLVSDETDINKNLSYQSVTKFMDKHAMSISIAGCFILVLTCYGASLLTASTKFDRMFRKDDPTVVGLHWIEEHIGPTTSVEIIVQFAPNTNSLIEQASLVSMLTETIRIDTTFGGALSAADFLPPVPTRKGIRGAAMRGVYESKFRDKLGELQKQGWFAKDSSGQYVWRITCKITALQQSYGYFVNQLHERIDVALANRNENRSESLRIDITGLSPLAHEAQMLLISDLGNSFLLAFVTITPVMMLIVRSVPVGVLLMLPNVLPPSIVFGCAGMLGYPIDIASILTASIAMGIAVDDTLHYVNWFTRGKKHGHSTTDAIRSAYQSCTVAMCETTLISCAAMLPFLFSDFVPTQRFSFLMIVMLGLALVGDLLLLPALLIAYHRLKAAISPAVRS